MSKKEEINKNILYKISKQDMLLLIMDYLRVEGFDRSYISLEEESNVNLYNYDNQIDLLRKLVLDGEWEEVEKFFNGIKQLNNIPYNNLLFEIKKEKLIEEIELQQNQNEVEGLAQELKEIQELGLENEFNDLINYLKNNNEEEQNKNSNIISRRLNTFNKIRSYLINYFPLNNNETLIQPGKLVCIISKLIENFVNCNHIIIDNGKDLNLNFIDNIIEKQIKNTFTNNAIRTKKDFNEDKFNNKFIKNNINNDSEIIDSNQNEDIINNNEINTNNNLKNHNNKINNNDNLLISPISDGTMSNFNLNNNNNIKNNIYYNSILNNNSNNQTNCQINNNNINNVNNNNIEQFLTNNDNLNIVNRTRAKENIIDLDDLDYNIQVQSDSASNLALSKSQNNNNFNSNSNNNFIPNCNNINTNKNKYNDLSDLDQEEYYMKSCYDFYNYDITTLSLKKVIEDSNPIRCCCFSPKGDYFAVGTNSRSVKIFDLSYILDIFNKRANINNNNNAFGGGTNNINNNALNSLREGTNNTNNNSNNNNSNYINNTLTKRTQRETIGMIFERKNHHYGSIYCIDWSSSGKLLATGSNDKTIKLMNIPELERERENFTNNNINNLLKSGENETLELQITGMKGIVRSLCFEPSNDLLLLSANTGETTVKLWDSEKGQNIINLQGHANDISSIKWSNDSQLCASSGLDKTIRFWDLRDYKNTNIISTLKYSDINDISIFTKQSSTLIAAAHNDGLITIWDYSRKCVVKEICEHFEEVRTINFSPDGKYLLSGSFDSKIKIFDVNNNFELMGEMEHADRVVSCKWHPEIPLIVSTSADKTARVWIPQKF